MTSKNIDWSKLDEMIDKSKEIVSDFNRIGEITKAKEELFKQKNILDNEESKIKEKYKQEYTKKLNDRLDDYGILTIVTANDYYEGRIISVTKDEIKIRYTYGSYADEIVISTQELKEKGFVKVEVKYRTIYVVDNIKNPLDVFEIIKFRLNIQVGEEKRKLKYATEQIVEYTKKVEDTKKELKQYEKVSDGMITKVFNNISFGVTDLKIEDVLKALPREICLYKDESDEK